MPKGISQKSQVLQKSNLMKLKETKSRIKELKKKEQELTSTCVAGKNITIHMKHIIHPISKKKKKVISFAKCECGKSYISKFTFETQEDVCTFLNDMH
jgi:hypothetical protein